MFPFRSPEPEPEPELDPTLTRSFLLSFLILSTIPWLRSHLRLSALKSQALSLLKGMPGFSSPPPPPPPETNEAADADTPPEADGPGIARHNGIPYVKLNGDYHHCLRSAWTNDPRKLYLESCFDPRSETNLAKDFNIEGLCPVVKATEGDRYILRDAREKYYLWDAWSGKLRRFWETWTDDVGSREELVAGLVCNITWAEMQTDVIHSWTGSASVTLHA